jgi:uncharacterized protein YbjT (DUF2867 family)
MLLQQHPRPFAARYAAAMPVVVTGASGLIGRAAVRAFSERSPEVRAYVRQRDAADPLRALGAKVAVGEIDDVDNLVVVMRGAHTVCHLVGAADLPDEQAHRRANLDSVRWALEAATDADIARFLFVSCASADPASADPLLRSKALAEDAIRTSGIDHVIIRTAFVYGPGSPLLRTTRRFGRSRRAPALEPGMGPVFVGDVAAVLAAADDREHSVSGTWSLHGPDRASADERDAAAEFGVALTSLREGLARSEV